MQNGLGSLILRSPAGAGSNYVASVFRAQSNRRPDHSDNLDPHECHATVRSCYQSELVPTDCGSGVLVDCWRETW